MTSQATSATAATTDTTSGSGPLLVFVLGAPCSGKSTLCAASAKLYKLDHFSLGDELRSLVSEEPCGHAARIKTLFSNHELETFRSNLHAGTLGLVHLTSKYVKERVFPTDCDHRNIRVLIDGFPRDTQRWEPFKEFAEPYWMSSKKSVLIVLDVEEEVARERFVKREMNTEIVEAMEKDDLTVCRLGKESENLQIMMESLAEMFKQEY